MHYFFQSVTFTNGGMRYSLSNFRLSQTLLKTPIVGEVVNSLMCKLPQGVTRFLSGRQFASIWSPVSVTLFCQKFEILRSERIYTRRTRTRNACGKIYPTWRHLYRTMMGGGWATDPYPICMIGLWNISLLQYTSNYSMNSSSYQG